MTRSPVIQWGTPPAEYYDGILMRANPALHRQAMDVLLKYAPRGGLAIDVGSGQGAFATRLRDHGFQVTAVDMDPDDFKAEGIDFTELNFDVADQVSAFTAAHAGRYDLAIGMEVIEHVENPFDYCRFLLSLVKPGGIVLVTTPNAESIHSRVDMLFTGHFLHFEPSDTIHSGHINPLTFHELRVVAERVGAEILDLKAICPMPWVVVSRRPANILRSLFASMLRPFLAESAAGDAICLVLRRPFEAAASSAHGA